MTRIARIKQASMEINSKEERVDGLPINLGLTKQALMIVGEYIINSRILNIFQVD